VSERINSNQGKTPIITMYIGLKLSLQQL